MRSQVGNNLIAVKIEVGPTCEASGTTVRFDLATDADFPPLNNGERLPSKDAALTIYATAKLQAGIRAPCGSRRCGVGCIRTPRSSKTDCRGAGCAAQVVSDKSGLAFEAVDLRHIAGVVQPAASAYRLAQCARRAWLHSWRTDTKQVKVERKPRSWCRKNSHTIHRSNRPFLYPVVFAELYCPSTEHAYTTQPASAREHSLRSSGRI